LNAFTNKIQEEQQFLVQWRREGPLGILIAIINYIKTPQQYDLFASFQKIAADEVPLELRHKALEPVKPVVTRWNSFYCAFERAALLQGAFNAYANYHIKTTTSADALALGRNNNRPYSPAWMRSTGLSAADWAVVTKYIDLLKPLKVSTERLEGRGKSGKYGAIYEIIPVFEYLLGALESRYRQYKHVNFDAHYEAPEDHLAINLKAAWVKANSYYLKLDDSPVYYAACCLHPQYKYYCKNSWADQEGWIETNEAALKQLWSKFKPPRASTARARPHKQDDINDTINAIADHHANKDDELDELEQWRKCEPQWTDTQFQKSNVVRYWIDLALKYPNLSRLAVDILTIPASSCECERLFSELGDLLEPKRRKIGAKLLAALQLIRSWVRRGFTADKETVNSYTDEDMGDRFGLDDWDQEDTAE
jgi:hypothetical protein